MAGNLDQRYPVLEKRNGVGDVVTDFGSNGGYALVPDSLPGDFYPYLHFQVRAEDILVVADAALHAYSFDGQLNTEFGEEGIIDGLESGISPQTTVLADNSLLWFNYRTIDLATHVTDEGATVLADSDFSSFHSLIQEEWPQESYFNINTCLTDTNGRVLCSGYIRLDTSISDVFEYHALVVRMDANANFDESWHETGMLVVAAEGTSYRAMVLLDNGNVLVHLRKDNGENYLQQLKPDGTTMAEFGDAGFASAFPGTLLLLDTTYGRVVLIGSNDAGAIDIWRYWL